MSKHSHRIWTDSVSGIHWNLSPPRLVEEALRRDEGTLTASGALRVETGRHTGRAPRDKFVVEDAGTANQIWWEENRPFSPHNFHKLQDKVAAYLQDRQVYIFDGYAGADPRHRLSVRVITELAWHNLFAHQLFIRPEPGNPALERPDVTVIVTPHFHAEPEVDGTRSESFIILGLEDGVVLIGGTEYAGEIKKSIFTVMNYFMPQKGVLPMHCAANIGEDGTTALFFGLSGTGKTTLSADPSRRLIGDDEHGWSNDGIFNFEGGCYAKCIHLSEEKEPQIWDAIRFGTLLENVVVDTLTGEVDFSDVTLTENTRAAYPVDFIPGAMIPGQGVHPSTILFLTADAFGVLPPISRLTPEQAVFYFLSGYTSKVAGTEQGVTEPEATFSACFGAPFLPLPPDRYARMLGEKIRKHGSQIYLVNTGWTGGSYGTGNRISLKDTRAMVAAALNGSISRATFRPHPVFRVELPDECPDVPSHLLDPRGTWADKAAYDRTAAELAKRFLENLERFKEIELESVGPLV